MIEVSRLSKRYGDFLAVDDVSFAVNEGAILGILGPNGAGKTTIIRMITGFLPPTAGRVTVASTDLARDASAARRQIGYLPENVALYPEMRVSEYLTYRALLTGISRSAAKGQIGRAMERCLISDVARQTIGTLSKGYRQRVGLAAAILHQPRVLVLDEPTVGLDPRQIIAIRDLIRELGRERTLLLSTHILPEVELLCDRVVIIDEGKLVAEGTPESLGQRSSSESFVVLELKEAPADAQEMLAAVDGVCEVVADESRPQRFRLACAGESDPREEIFRAAVERGWVLLELLREQASLEEVFVRLTTREAAPGAAAAGEATESASDAHGVEESE